MPGRASSSSRPGLPPSGSRGYFRRVWEVVRRIPPGRVATYGAVARAAGFPGTARQVAWALRGAPRTAVLPWHRVLGAGGHILLPAESGAEQRLRLEAESITFAGRRVRMDRHQVDLQAAGPGRRQPRPGSARKFV